MDPLLDTSWTLHSTNNPSTTYQNLFTQATTHEHLSQSFSHLPGYLTSHLPSQIDDFSTTKHGTLTSIKTTQHTLPSTTRLIRLQLHYQNTSTTLTYILYNAHLLLSKSPQSTTRHILSYLSETFDNTEFHPLKLPSSFISSTLQTYLTSLVDSTEDSDVEHRAAILRAAIGTLKLTLLFSGSVAPHLRTLDIGVPYETVDVLAAEGLGFMEGLAEYVRVQTGLKMPLGGEGEGKGVEGVVPVVRISKVATAAFAVGVEGRLRFAARPVTSSPEYEDAIVMANLGLLEEVVREAMKGGDEE